MPATYDCIQSMHLINLGLVLFVAVVAAALLGNWLGARRHGQPKADKGADGMAAAALGILALLIGFSFSMAVTRYDLRRQAVLEEANAIGSTANFALMLPALAQTPIIDLLRDYTKVRIGLGIPYDPAKMQRDMAKSVELQGKLWQQAVAVTAAAPQSLPAYRFVASLNETNNIGEKRVTALRNHVPVLVFLMLCGTAIIAMGFTGYGAGVNGARQQRVPIAIMAALITLLIMMTQDLERPDRGNIEVSTQALTDALNGMPH